jgi:beta-lactamase regulating signal transducer with metallopeptidase domain
MTTQLLSQNAFLFQCIWQSTICIALGISGSYLLRRRPARAHQLLLLAVIAAVIVPVMSTLVRHYNLGLFVAPIPSAAPLENTVKFNYDQPEEVAAVKSAHTRLSAFEKSAAPAVSSAPEAIRIPWVAILIAGWIGATTILLARLLVTFALGVRLLGRAEPVQRSDIEQGMSLAKAKLGVDPPVRILSAEKVGAPLIWCWARQPILLVPRATARTGDKLDWASVVCHELAHYKRRDHIAGLSAELAVCIFPWNVLLWWAKRRLVRLSEQACDDWVLAAGREADDYAESLLDLLPQRLMAFAPAVVSSKNGLAGRIRRILQAKCTNPRTGVLWALAVTIIAASLAITAAFAQTRPAKDNNSDDAAEGAREDIPRQVCQGMLFEEARRLIAKDKLPVLHKMLEDEAYASCWHNVARLIGYVSNDTNSVPVLLRYFEREEGPKFDSIDSLSGKIWTLVFVGQIGGPVADSVLRQALTDEGAARLAKSWIDGQLVPNTPFWGDRNSVITYIRSCAATGLVLSRRQENIDIVKRLYADCKTGKENSPLLEQHLAESLAIHDFITENGLEAYLGLDVSGTAMLEALRPYLKKYQGESPSSPTPLLPTRPPRKTGEPTGTIETGPVPGDPEPNQSGPRITFESETHDFGQVPPGSKNTCEFKFKNTGDAMLTVAKIKTTCGCTVASLTRNSPEKKDYQPGETGTITITYKAGKRPGRASKHIHVPSNDKTRPKVSLTIKADIVLHVNPDPDELALLLNRENARCPDITLVSIDGEPFAIKSITAPANWFTADFDSSVEATRFVLKPRVDMEQLKSKQHGFVKIAVTHPKCKTVQIPYNVLPRFKRSPRTIILRDAKPGEPMTKPLSIISNYQEQFEIESVSCSTDAVRVVNKQKADHSITLELEIIPPPIADKIYFKDVLYVNMKDGEQVRVDLRGFYKKDKKTTPARRRR